MLLLVLLVSGCDHPQEKLPVLRIGHAPHDHHAPLYVAAMNPDHFKQNGGIYLQEVTFRKEYRLIADDRPVARLLVDSSTGGAELIRRLSERRYDVSFGGVPAMLKFIDKGRPVRMISPVMSEGAGLVVRNDLAADNWSDFVALLQQRDEPLRIGYKTAVSVQNLIFEQALETEGIPFAAGLENRAVKVSLINMKGAKNLIPALRNGVIDGFVVMQPFLSLAKQRQAGKTIALLRDLPPTGKWHGHPCCALAANDHFLAEHPQITETLLTLILRARQLIAKQPKKSAGQVARWLDMPEIVERESLPTIDFNAGLDERWNRGIDNWIDKMVASKRLTGKVREAHEQGKVRQLIYDGTLYDKASQQLK